MSIPAGLPLSRMPTGSDRFGYPDTAGPVELVKCGATIASKPPIQEMTLGSAVRRSTARFSRMAYLLRIPRMLTKKLEKTVWKPKATSVAPGTTNHIVRA